MRGPVGFGKRLRFERLEARTVLNGTVMVTNAGGALTITGDVNSNYFQVQQTGTTAGGGVNVRVTGFATKIDNLDTGKTGTSFTFTGVTSVTVDESAGGSNHITIAGVNIGTTGDLSVNIGDGNNILTVVNVKSNDASFDFGNGNDVASFVNLSTAGDGDISIDAGDGRDVVVLNNVHAGTSSSPADLSVDFGTGSDTLSVFNVSASDASFDFGNGNDVASFVNLRATGDISMDAGDGRNVMVLNNVHAGTSSSPGDLSVDLGSGSHNVVSVALSSAGDASFSTGGSDGILVWKHTGNHFTAETDSGFSIVV